MSTPTHRITRFAMSGSAGTGKTTLGKRLAARLGLPFIEEGMREHLQAGLDLHALTREQHRELQCELFDAMMAAAMRSHEKAGGFVCDRSPLDFAAFWLYYGFAMLDGAATETFMSRIESALTHFDVIVVLPWGAIPLKADGIRSSNRWLQLHFQALLEGLCLRQLEAGRFWSMPIEVTDANARLEWVLARLERQVR